MHSPETVAGEPVKVCGIGVWPMGLIGGVGMLAFGVLFVLAAMASLSGVLAGMPGASAGRGAAAVGMLFLVAIVVYPIMGLIVGMVTALLYNAAGAITGGVEITVRE